MDKALNYEERAQDRIDQIKSLIMSHQIASPVKILNVIKKLSQSPHKQGFGKGKGKAYERRIGKILGEWWQDSPFRPTPCSGGWDKLAHDDKHLAVGDLFIPKDCDFPFSVECKKQEGWSLIDLIKPNRKNVPIFEWWAQAACDAKAADKIPLLVFSKNHLGIDLVATTFRPSQFGLQPQHLNAVVSVLKLCHYAPSSIPPTWDLCILTLSDFMETSPSQPKGGITSSTEEDKEETK